MFSTLLQMALVLLCGALWRFFRPGGLDTEVVRRSVATLVYYLLLPALILQVMWQAPLGLDTLRIVITAAAGVFCGLLFGWLAAVLLRMPKAVAGAALLAAGFPNVTYLGLPVLEASFGPWARGIAIQYDLLACSPLLMSVGLVIAANYSELNIPKQSTAKTLLQIPALWAMAVALVFNISHIPAPVLLAEFIHLLGACVVPLMLISLGMSLQWQAGMRGKRISLFLVSIIQLLLVPIMAWTVAVVIGLQGEVLMATVIEAAMPCMVLGVVICDRYKLDTSFYAVTVTLSTIASLLTLPLWLHILQFVNLLE